MTEQTQLTGPRGPRARVWVLVLTLAVLCGGTGAAVTALRPSAYQSTAVLTVETVDVASDDAGPLAEASRLRELYGPLLQTEPVAQAIADDLGISEQQVVDHVSAVVVRNSLLLLIRATATTSASAQRLAAAATRALVNYTADLQQREGVPLSRAASLQVLSPAAGAGRVTNEVRTIATVSILMTLLGALLGLAVVSWRERRAL